MSQISIPVESTPALIDAHCHLEQGYYGAQLPEVMQRARDVGLQTFIAVGASRIVAGAHEAVALSAQTEDVYASIGIHPCEAHLATDDHMAELESLFVHPKVVALGEVGLDYYHDASTEAVQKKRFVQFIAMAQRTGRPLMLHIRDAHDDCLALFKEHGVPQAGAMIHCFTAGPKTAQAYLDLGLYLSIPGVVTFKNAQPLRDAVAMIPQDRLLVETDSPYLAPVPMRGKQNEPAFVRHTAEAVAALRHVPYAELATQCTINAQRFFKLPAKA
jgi:TatD DNase family protein